MGNGMDLLGLINLFKQSKNPQQLVLNLIKEKGGDKNPFFENLLTLGKQGKQEDILNIARNTMREQGKDFDKEFEKFRKMLGL